VPEATVLIPTFDHGPTLRYAVASALAQTVQDLEVLVVGDGVPDVTREIMGELCARDERVRFFDNPKGPRHGEIHRHTALQDARGRIVCYLSDDDIWLPGHLEAMGALLAEADFANTLPLRIGPDGSLYAHAVDFALLDYRKLILAGKNRMGISPTGHTMELYRRLPHGWRTSPPEIHSDLYMWQQILSVPDCRAASGTRPTVLHFPSRFRTEWSTDERLAELERWSRKLDDPAWEKELLEQVMDVVVPQWARFKARKKWQGRLRRFDESQAAEGP
jgi:hypothetical protein